MMPPEIAKMLAQEKKTPLHDAILELCQVELRKSRGAMQSYYSEWDIRAEVYMKRRPVDKNDVEALKQGLPKKIVVPMSYSQIDTCVAFGYMLLTQRDKFYEYKPVSDNDNSFKFCAEELVQRDLNSTDHKGRLVQNLLDVCRFGLSCEVDAWDKEFAYVPISSLTPPEQFNGIEVGEATVTTAVEKVLKREGNTIRRISPYRVFPDANFHITDWRKGSYFAWDDEFSRPCLQTMESEGMVAGMQWVSKYDNATLAKANRQKARFAGININDPTKSDVICVTQMVYTVVPSEVKGSDGTKLSDVTFPHKWLFWIANDNRVIRAEPLNYLHAQIPASLGFFASDAHDSSINSLAYMIDDLQALTSWFMNSRMAAVTRCVDNQVIVDPLGINVADVESRHRVIRLQKAGANKDVRKFIMQNEIRDTTQGHVGDMTNLVGMMQMVTGVNDNAMGQYNGGRRSATEARSVMSGASARMKKIFDVLWGQFYQPQANRLLINHRQGISQEEFVSVCGEEKADYYAAFKGDPRQLVRSYDFVTYDGTLPSEKLFLAQQLQELLGLLLTNPLSAAAFNMDPNKIQKEIMQLRGLGTGGQFGYDQVPQNLIAALQMGQSGPQNQPANAPPV